MLLSRNTYAVYWMSRYLERAENIARFIDVNFHLMMDLPGQTPDDWSPFISITGDEDLFYQRYPNATKRHVLQFLVNDSEYGNSVVSCLEMARQNALHVRDIITSEMWELINRYYLFLKDQAKFPITDAHAFFAQMKNFNREYLGILDASLSRDEVWHFCRLGHFVERADKTSRILDVRYFMLQKDQVETDKAYQGIQWAALLKSVEALDMYRKNWRLIHPYSVVRFLLLDELFPRSVLHCVTQVELTLLEIVHGQVGAPHLVCLRKLRALKAWLHAETSSDFVENHLHEAIDELQNLLNRFDDSLHEEFFDIHPQSAEERQLEEVRTLIAPLPLHRPELESWNSQGGMAQ